LPELMNAQLGSLLPKLTSLLPPDIATEQFRAALFLELTGRPDLAECTPESIRECVVKAATYGLLPGRDVHFLPFRNRRKGGKKDATYVPNYLGLILALERTGKVKRAFAHPVYEGDEYGFDYFSDRPIHKPALSLGKSQGKILFYYGAILMKDGTCHFEVLTLEDIAAVKARGPAHDDGPWVTDPIMMARKTALKRVAKYVKVTPAMQDMLEEDAARERADIPEARHRQNIIDLFGDDAVNTQTGEMTPLQVSGNAPPAREVAPQSTPSVKRALAQTTPPADGILGDARALQNDNGENTGDYGASWGPTDESLWDQEEAGEEQA